MLLSNLSDGWLRLIAGECWNGSFTYIESKSLCQGHKFCMQIDWQVENPPGDSGVLSGSFRQPFTVIRTWWQLELELAEYGKVNLKLQSSLIQLLPCQTFPSQTDSAAQNRAQPKPKLKKVGSKFSSNWAVASCGEWVSGKRWLFLPNARECHQWLKHYKPPPPHHCTNYYSKFLLLQHLTMFLEGKPSLFTIPFRQC